MSGVMTIPETAAWLRINPKVTYKLAKRGQLPGAMKVGGSWRVYRAALMEEFLKCGAEVDGGTGGTEESQEA